MAKEICLVVEGEASSFAFSKLDRARLYGRKVRLVLDSEGGACTSAQLTTDGSALVPSGGTTLLYANASFDTVSRSSLQAVDAAGVAVEKVPSTLGIAQPARRIEARRVLETTVHSVYELEPTELGASLSEALEGGAIFESTFNYRDDYEAEILFLLKNDEGLFGLVARPDEFSFLSREVISDDLEEEESDEPSDDDFDFSMM